MTSQDKVEQLRQALEEYAAHGGGTLFDREAEEEKAKVRNRALGLLDQRARSRHELEQRLCAADFPPAVVDEVLDDFERTRLLDDQHFANEWVRQRHARRGKSTRVLDRELREKGVRAEQRAEALAQIDAADEEHTATTVAEKKARSVKQVPADRREYDKYLRRIVSALARRGFNEGMSIRIGRRALDERIEQLGE